MSDIFQANYAALDVIAATFALQAATIERLHAALVRDVDALRNGGWIGRGVHEFLTTLDSEVQPAVQRLHAALEQAKVVTIQAAALIRQAEEAAAAPYQQRGLALMSSSYGASATVLPDRVPDDPTPTPARSAASSFSNFVAKIIALIRQSMLRGSVSEEQALEMFNDMANEPDIPFNYGDDGCYARAYMMGKRLTERYGIAQEDTAKVFIFGDLHVATENRYSRSKYPDEISSNDGVIDWRYHVAPAIKVRQADGTALWKIIDPSISDTPLTLGDWKQKMSDRNAQIEVRGYDWYGPAQQITDDNRAEVEAHAGTTMKNYLDRCKDAGYCK